MKTRWVILPLIALSALPSLGRGQSAERGAAIGGIGGALAGAAIGKNNGNTAAGALIGGAVGLLGGAAVGAAREDAKQRKAYESQQVYQYSRAVSSIDVVSMVQNGVGDDVIINHIRENGVQRRPDVNEVISLHRQGVSNNVISVMQNAPEGGRVAAPPPAVYHSRPVVVEEHYYVPTYRYYGPPPYYHHHHHHHRPSHVHWGVTIGR